MLNSGPRVDLQQSALHRPDLGPVTRDEVARRRQAVLEEMVRDGFDGLIVLSGGGTSLERYANNFYLAGAHAPSAELPDCVLWEDPSLSALVFDASDGAAVLVINGGGLDCDSLGLDDVRDTAFVVQALAEVLRDRGLDRGRLALDGSEVLSLRAHRRLMAELGREKPLIEADGLVRRHRRVKSPAEISQIRSSARAGVVAVSEMLLAVTEGRAEAEVAAEGIRSFTSSGGAVLDAPIASGPDTLRLWGGIDVPNLHAGRTLAAGDLFHADFFGAVAGYFTDFARSTVVGGSPTDGQREVLEMGVLVVEDLMVPMVRPGMTGDQIYSSVEAWMRERGVVAPEDNFCASHPILGHGIGLSIFEEPLIVRGDKTPLEPGMVIAAEVFATGDAGGSYFEQVLLVTKDGCEILTADCPSVWWT